MKTAPLLEVSELFFSLQGESSFSGQPCVFIRLSGCNLRCNYCDARYTYEEEGALKSISEIVAFAEKYPDYPVEITGGEPLLQKETIQLMEALLAAGRRVLLETNGSLSLANVPSGVIRIVDVKCPDSGMSEHFLNENLSLLTPDDELKFVLCSRNDYEWAVNKVRALADSPDRTIHFSPVADRLEPAELAEWILADRLPVRLQLQLHKILWPEMTRGK